MSMTTLQTRLTQPVRMFNGREMLAVTLAFTLTPAIFWLPGDLDISARMALSTFTLCVIGWTLTNLNDTFVALLGALGLVLTRTIDAEGFFGAIGASVVWLMIGAFIVARAINQSGLATRLTFAMTRSAKTVGQLFYLLTAVLLATSLIIPSTSARAALLMPVYVAIAATLKNERINRALAIAIPVNILLTAIGSLVGAGAHMVINDALGSMIGARFTFFEWLALGMPFAIVSAFGSTWVIVHLFLTSAERKLRLDSILQQQLTKPGRWTRQERYIAFITLILVALWVTESWHGVDNALAAVLGALAVSIPTFSNLRFKEAAKAVEWEMILFVAASLALSEALVHSGAGKWLVDTLLVRSGLSTLNVEWVIVVGVAAITLTSHLYITSRSARGAAIAPLVVLLALSLEIDPRILAFVTAAGVGYCITLVVSAKPLAMFQQVNGDQPSYRTSDLLRLSALLTPLHVLLIAFFAYFYWPYLLEPLSTQQEQAGTSSPASSTIWLISPAQHAAMQGESLRRSNAESAQPPRTERQNDGATSMTVQPQLALRDAETRQTPTNRQTQILAIHRILAAQAAALTSAFTATPAVVKALVETTQPALAEFLRSTPPPDENATELTNVRLATVRKPLCVHEEGLASSEETISEAYVKVAPVAPASDGLNLGLEKVHAEAPPTVNLTPPAATVWLPVAASSQVEQVAEQPVAANLAPSEAAEQSPVNALHTSPFAPTPVETVAPVAEQLASVDGAPGMPEIAVPDATSPQGKDDNAGAHPPTPVGHNQSSNESHHEDDREEERDHENDDGGDDGGDDDDDDDGDD